MGALADRASDATAAARLHLSARLREDLPGYELPEAQLWGDAGIMTASAFLLWWAFYIAAMCAVAPARTVVTPYLRLVASR